jgi:hypothetical protein
MKIFCTSIKFYISIFLCLSFCQKVSAQKNSDSTAFRNSLKLDIFPIYYDFFDYQKQIRVGVEYERDINNKSFAALCTDIGVFDDYSYTKYYDFFNQNQGMYSIRQDVIIKGFHIIPSYNFYFFQSEKKSNQGIYAGGIIDYHFYRKRLDNYNSLTTEDITYRYEQSRIGVGLNAGAKYGFGKHFFAEVKTALCFKIYYYFSGQFMNPIKPLNAEWTDSKNNFWLVLNVRICYAF